MKKLIITLLACCALFLTSCVKDAKQETAKKTEQLMQDMNASVGMPSITNYQEKRLAKMIFELRDKTDLVTYAYIMNLQGKLIYLGKCIGYGLPYSVQYTSPETYHYNGVTLPQADPNGLYMPEGLSATWLIMEDPNTGETKPVYVEQEILVSPFKLH